MSASALCAMPGFALDPRLRQDCLVLGHLDFSELLLMNKAELPWFILVPHTRHTELYELTPQEQERLMREIATLSRLIKEHFGVAKLNVAAIGNIVAQLHIHVVGRYVDDPCWPGVVWGRTLERCYGSAQVQDITAQLERYLGSGFTPAAPGVHTPSP